MNQLAEVYGIDTERYENLAPWFKVDTTHIQPLEVNTLPFATLLKHPYLNYQQVKVILQLRKQKGKGRGRRKLAYASFGRRRHVEVG